MRAIHSSGVARGGGQALSPHPQEFGRLVNPIQAREADYAPRTTASPPDSKSYLHLCTVLSFVDFLADEPQRRGPNLRNNTKRMFIPDSRVGPRSWLIV